MAELFFQGGNFTILADRSITLGLLGNVVYNLV